MIARLRSRDGESVASIVATDVLSDVHVTAFVKSTFWPAIS